MYQNEILDKEHQIKNNIKIPVFLKKFQRFALIGIPVILFIGGLHCLYDSYYILKEQQMEREIN